MSDVDGFKEVVIDEKTGIIVPREDPKAAAEAMKKLVMNLDTRKTMGMNARNHVKEHYEWKRNVEQMIATYKTVIEDFHGE